MPDLTLIPSDEPLELQKPIDDIDEADAEIINDQAVIEKDTIDWQSGFQRFQNFEVDAYFQKIDEDNLPLQSQKDYLIQLTRIDDSDALLKSIGKYLLFDRIRGMDLSALNEVYTLPLSAIANISLGNKPQLHMYFVEVNYLIDSGRDIADGQIAGIRLMELSAPMFSPPSVKKKTRDLC